MSDEIQNDVPAVEGQDAPAEGAEAVAEEAPVEGAEVAAEGEEAGEDSE